jgi:hypothetical protein
MAQTFPGIRENLGRHVSVEKFERQTILPLGEWPSRKTILLLKKMFFKFPFLILVGLFFLFFISIFERVVCCKTMIHFGISQGNTMIQTLLLTCAFMQNKIPRVVFVGAPSR